MAWTLVGEGNSFDDLKLLVANRELPKGTRVRFKLKLNMPIGPAFDVAGAELIFKSQMPEGLTLKDVRGDGLWEATIDAEANSPGLMAILLFIKAHWLAIVIGGFFLYLVLTNIKFFADFATGLSKALPWILLLILVTLVIFIAKGLKGLSLEGG